MKFEFDMSKNEANIQKHGLRFLDVHHLKWKSAIFKEDMRYDYGKIRFNVLIEDPEGQLYNVVVTPRGDDVMRVISFRRAHEKERKKYVQKDE